MVNEHTRIRMAKGKGLLACLTGYVESVRLGTLATSMEGFTKNKYTRKIHKFNKEFNGKKKKQGANEFRTNQSIRSRRWPRSRRDNVPVTLENILRPTNSKNR